MITKEACDAKDHQLTVALRIRPISMAELEEGATLIAHKVDDQMVVLMDPLGDPDDVLRANRSREKSYMFDVAFDFAATQDIVYRTTTKGLIEGVISGYNATIFAYGPTGCGKTYTMLGTDSEPGIYVRMLNDLFHAIEETSNDMDYEVSMSYLEIYNEMIRDLLNPSLGYLDLREDSKGVIQVAGITEVSTINAKEIMQLLMKGNKQRTQEPTAANRTSSRSHAVLQVTVRQKSRIKNIMQEVRVGRLFMIDLAGSERASQTQNRGQRMKEGAHINRSLLALGNCINALSDRAGVKYVNYRDSKLTRLLKDSLGGNSRTVMIAHISPASSAFEESRSTLTYAERAKCIRTTVKRNLLNVSYHIAQYTSIIADLRNEIHRLQRKIEQQEPRRARHDIRSIQAEVQLHGNSSERQEMDQLREQLISTFREQMDVRRHLMELENNYMEIQIESSRHLLIIADWEQEKARRAQKWREEQRKESDTKDESEKDSDTGDDLSDVPEPQEVTLAREHITTLLGEQDKLQKQKAELEKRFWEVRQRGHRLEEALPWRISSEEQREVLSLLCKVHELEVENTAIQSGSLLKDNLIRHQERTVHHFERHRSLCHRIIHEQRQIIQESQTLVPSHLEELYQAYLQDLEEGSLDRVAALDHVAVRVLKDTSVPKLPPLPAESIIDSDQESVRTLGSEYQHQLWPDSRRGTLPPLVPEIDSSETNQVFKTSPRARQIKNPAVVTPPPIHVNGMISQEYTARESLVSLGSQRNSSPDNSDHYSDGILTRGERKAIVTGTKSIAVKAARRRSRVLESDRLNLLEPTKEHSSLSLQSLSESEDPLCRETPNLGQPASPNLQHAISEDNLSTSTGETIPRRNAPRHSPGPWIRVSKKGSKKLEKREESLEAKRRKRRSRSFEVTGHRLPCPNTNGGRWRPLESSSEHKIIAAGGMHNTRGIGKAAGQTSKVKLLPAQPSSDPTEASFLSVTSSQAGITKKTSQPGQRPLRLNCVAVHGTNLHGKDGRTRRC
ncbi:kinesin-like protein KIF19 isoform X2 [Anolis carolinensis]|uniref:kinesin-like protein KIF19 isoform X2 n=1 Tax=Anolis carolinensis TaxID=28377 RepID=UPI000462E1F3|nr:PREDICTED: kinesin-like protein KIF19 isoform X2 [Anolis carolinensis]|eukprot:XP_008102328.1 PREDICTED: kinesin-like protein KIF19 isoform X2 [Anolis carolinensis]